MEERKSDDRSETWDRRDFYGPYDDGSFDVRSSHMSWGVSFGERLESPLKRQV